MGAFDGYWVPRYGVLSRGCDDSTPHAVSGFYVSWDSGYGGATGKWSDTKEEADALFDKMAAEGKTNVACWFEPKRTANLQDKPHDQD